MPIVHMRVADMVVCDGMGILSVGWEALSWREGQTEMNVCVP